MANESESGFSRRSFLVLAGAAVGAVACKDVSTGPTGGCADVSSLEEAKKSLRDSFKYVEPAQDAARECIKCVQYVERAAGQCGGCKLDIGPVSPIGTCIAFANG